ncbi:MAG: glycerol-3-phosphate dehydrogenase [Hyphomicrobiales bacterium]|nr:NAD(P)-dependent glycerol-3-phosphate dehydrogenase [Hyphomicrobiales bacterium]PCH50374.1 MAG: glycerol-3-phosphate dehydrogenase [Hyphomicrobiales bacterium]
MSDDNQIAVLGAGAFGTAMACVAARKGNNTLLWGRDKSICKEINTSNTNSKYLGETILPKNIEANSDLHDVLKSASTILLAIPAQTISSITQEIKKHISPDTSIVLCTKGIDQKTGLLPSQTITQILPEVNISALSGPSFASDIAKGLPTAITIASNTISNAQTLALIISDPAFRLYASDDLVGVELGGALKNVIAVAVGVCRSMQLGASAEAALIARGFAELTRLATKLGAQQNTLSGLSGLGDLVLTCSSPKSRNFSYGMSLGSQADLSKLPLAEGAFTASIANKIAIKNNVDCPIIAMVASMVAGEINSREAVQKLLSRPLRQE